MLKKSLFTIFSIYFFIIILTGCIEFGTEVNDSGFKNKTVTMSAQEVIADIVIDTDFSDGYSLLYNSLNNGDSLIIKDVIDDIYYNSNSYTTTIIFKWDNKDGSDFLELIFDENLMDLYEISNEVEINVKIKYVTFTFENFNFEMEIYEQQWESEEYYKSNIESGGNGFKPLPKSCIKLL